MKVSFRPDGTVEIDVDTAEQALELARGAHAQTEQEKIEKRTHAAELVSLTPKQRKLYDTLAELDCPEGCHLSGLAELVESTDQAVGQMCCEMIKRGLVQRVSRGHYRAVKQDNRFGDGMPHVRAV